MVIACLTAQVSWVGESNVDHWLLCQVILELVTAFMVALPHVALPNTYLPENLLLNEPEDKASFLLARKRKLSCLNYSETVSENITQ